MQTQTRTWTYGIVPRILLGGLAAFMAATGVFIFLIPSLFGGTDHSADWIVDCTALVILGFALFMTFGLIAVLRTRIALNASSLDATVPGHHNWLLVPSFRTIALPLGEIRSVERREEVLRQFGLSNLRESLSVVTTGGERIGIISNTSGPASQLPIDEIAGAIAAAAGLPVTDDGTVVSKSPGLYGEASPNWNEPRLDEKAAGAARKSAIRTAQIVLGLVMLTFVLRACL